MAFVALLLMIFPVYLNYRIATSQFKVVIFTEQYTGTAGGGERVDPSDPCDRQRSAGMSRVLAHLQHHGCQPVRRPVCQLRRHGRSADQRQPRSQRDRLCQPGTSQLYMDQPRHQLRQRTHGIPRTLPSGRLICSLTYLFVPSVL